MIHFLGEHLGVVPINEPVTTKSGLIVPINTKKIDTIHARVKFIGEGCKSGFKVGDEVVYGKGAAMEVTIGADDSEKVYVVKETSLYAYIQPD